jgi:hypothetical protein
VGGKGPKQAEAAAFETTFEVRLFVSKFAKWGNT